MDKRKKYYHRVPPVAIPIRNAVKVTGCTFQVEDGAGSGPTFSAEGGAESDMLCHASCILYPVIRHLHPIKEDSCALLSDSALIDDVHPVRLCSGSAGFVEYGRSKRRERDGTCACTSGIRPASSGISGSGKVPRISRQQVARVRLPD